LTSVGAVSPIIEIGECVRALEQPANFLYQWNFVKDLKRRMRRKEQFWPGLFDLTKLGRIHTVREFDEAYTAPYFGFKDAEDYYHRASAMRVVDRVRLPALIIMAEDDPFVPAQSFHDPKVADNPNITLLACKHGGHCGFVGPAAAQDDGYWAENQIVDFTGRGSIKTSASAPSASARTPGPSLLPRA
jgi:predicted alpha/beta-fold hydrolase